MIYPINCNQNGSILRNVLYVTHSKRWLRYSAINMHCHLQKRPSKGYIELTRLIIIKANIYIDHIKISWNLIDKTRHGTADCCIFCLSFSDINSAWQALSRTLGWERNSRKFVYSLFEKFSFISKNSEYNWVHWKSICQLKFNIQSKYWHRSWLGCLNLTLVKPHPHETIDPNSKSKSKDILYNFYRVRHIFSNHYPYIHTNQEAGT